MDLADLIDGLSVPAAYPYPVAAVEVRQTHISVVFLAGPFVYKVKKPVNPGFLDFTTLPQRRHFCEEEVRLNRRLAPEVYLGVVPVTQTANGLRFEGDGPAVEWAVKMQRLPEDATLHARLRRGEVGSELIAALGRRIAAFHRAAETNERTAAFGTFDNVARTIRDVFAEAVCGIGTTVSQVVFGRAKALADAALDRLHSVIAGRAARDCHGDLHLDHIYYFPNRQPPADVVIIDCIEFSERLRFIDPIADMAFVVMDLAYHGRRDLARGFADAYFDAVGDPEGRTLLPLYTAYRATVRGMVEGLESAETEVPAAERATVWRRARAHWLLALTVLEEPAHKPCLLLVAGLPGSGKSRLAAGLADSAGFSVIRSDVVRKELTAAEGRRDSIYSPEWNDRTYAECLRRARPLLFEGHRVLVDATFRDEQKRRLFLDAAVECGVPSAMLLCHAEPDTIRQRLASRRGDASDADWAVHLQLATSWEEIGPHTAPQVRTVSTEGNPEQALDRALDVLRQLGLHG